MEVDLRVKLTEKPEEDGGERKRGGVRERVCVFENGEKRVRKRGGYEE